MRRFLYKFGISTGLASIIVGLAITHPSAGLAPAIEVPNAESSQLPKVDSLEQLRQMRDQLRSELSDPSPTAESSNADQTGIIPASANLLQQLQAVEIRLQIEESAEENWQEAIRLANQASEWGKTPDPSPDLIGDIAALWRRSMALLQEIPEQSLRATAAAQKIEEYRSYVNAANYRYDTAQSQFLVEIAEKTGLPTSDVFITVCSLAGECRRLNGDQRPASPASLIKLPIAIALMQKVTDANINLDQPILVKSGNYTEDASDVWVNQEYPLRHVLRRMINQSSNIATNQLIDFLGWDYINQALRDRSYKTTFVGYKMVGESTYPANAGGIPNEMSADEITQMMVEIYQQKHRGDDVLIDALASQEDTVLGYDALKPTSAIWLGEKTGQNSQALGTTLAMSINGQTYTMTVVLNYSGNEAALRQCIRDVANHIAQNGGL